MSVVANDVLIVAPELSSFGNTIINKFINYAKLQISESVFGDTYDMAVIYLTAHILTKIGKGNEIGAVASESVGGISISYSNPTIGLDYDTTAYGRVYQMLKRQLATSPLIV